MGIPELLEVSHLTRMSPEPQIHVGNESSQNALYKLKEPNADLISSLESGLSSSEGILSLCKNYFHKPFFNLVQVKLSLPKAGGRDWITLNVPSNPVQSVILQFLIHFLRFWDGIFFPPCKILSRCKSFGDHLNLLGLMTEMSPTCSTFKK